MADATGAGPVSDSYESFFAMVGAKPIETYDSFLKKLPGAKPTGGTDQPAPSRSLPAPVALLLDAPTKHPLQVEWEQAAEDDVPIQEGDWVDVAEMLRMQAAAGGAGIETEELDENGVAVMKLSRASSGFILDGPGDVKVDNFCVDEAPEDGGSPAATPDPPIYIPTLIQRAAAAVTSAPPSSATSNGGKAGAAATATPSSAAVSTATSESATVAPGAKVSVQPTAGVSAGATGGGPAGMSRPSAIRAAGRSGPASGAAVSLSGPVVTLEDQVRRMRQQRRAVPLSPAVPLAGDMAADIRIPDSNPLAHSMAAATSGSGGAGASVGSDDDGGAGEPSECSEPVAASAHVGPRGPSCTITELVGDVHEAGGEGHGIDAEGGSAAVYSDGKASSDRHEVLPGTVLKGVTAAAGEETAAATAAGGGGVRWDVEEDVDEAGGLDRLADRVAAELGLLHDASHTLGTRTSKARSTSPEPAVVARHAADTTTTVAASPSASCTPMSPMEASPIKTPATPTSPPPAVAAPAIHGASIARSIAPATLDPTASGSGAAAAAAPLVSQATTDQEADGDGMVEYAEIEAFRLDPTFDYDNVKLTPREWPFSLRNAGATRM